MHYTACLVSAVPTGLGGTREPRRGDGIFGRRFQPLPIINDKLICLNGKELAKLIGVSRQTINAVESGRYVPSSVLVLKMARVFGKPVEEVFILDEND